MGRRAVTPRHGDVIAAATAGDLAALRSFDRAAVAGAVDKHGCTALHWAAGGGFPDCVAWLVDEGLCAVDAPQQTNGRAPLHFAARNGRVAACRCLVDHGGKVPENVIAFVNQTGGGLLGGGSSEGSSESGEFIAASPLGLPPRSIG